MSCGVFLVAFYAKLTGTPPPAHGPLVQLVSPGQSIQAAVNQAPAGGWIYVLPGIYRETADATNGLSVTKAINLVGLSTPKTRVVLENTGDQRNGIVVVPDDRKACMTCHVSLAPPFELLDDAPRGVPLREPTIRGVSIRGITIKGFINNGLFTENVDGFSIHDVESVDNRNYGIFPTLSRSGVISHSRVTGSRDSGVWVETSERVVVTDTLVEGNSIGFELSNSQDIMFVRNESRGNTIGMALLLLPHLFDERPGAGRLTIADNFIHDNNRHNDAPPGSLLSYLPSGVGILLLGVDDSVISQNRIETNNSAGLGVVDACLGLGGSRFDCSLNPRVTPAFLADQAATNNTVLRNILVRNGGDPRPSPFMFAAADIALLSYSVTNCFERNTFDTSFSLVGMLPSCP